MTDKQINLAIAEACGWTLVKDDPDFHEYWKHPKDGREIGVAANPYPFPNYVNDLNAMHEAEKVLSSKRNSCAGESQWSSYLEWLGYCWENKTSDVFQCVHATARQRAEGFLRTIGKWKEVTND